MTFNEQYSSFVDSLVSAPSSDFDAYIARLTELHEQGVNIQLLDTAAQGLSAEAGEFMGVIKKIKYQGKPYNEDVEFHLKRELGDIFFYLATGAQALNISLNDVILMNIEKLEARYPGGKFEIIRSEERKQGDI